ncbi:MAG: DUF1289 domain-containing protein [Chlorobi bacterium]|nr:DUF1289 domain-containing protein [Chlorobiota bacterium]
MGKSTDSTTIETPCRKICRIDHQTRLCIGCKRTRTEIAQWLFYTPAERRAIMQKLCFRRLDVTHESRNHKQ